MNYHTVSTIKLGINTICQYIRSVYYQSIPLRTLMPNPTYISLFTGRNCPLHCRHCSFWKKKEPYQLSYGQGKIMIDKLYTWLGPFRLNISGGEPLLTKDILHIIAYAEKKGIRCGMASNGYLITEEMAKKIVNSGLSNINISLDSLHANKHDRIRGTKGAFKKAVKAIQLLKRFRIGSQPLIYINAIISGENEKDLVTLAKWVKEEGLDGINFQPIVSDRTFGNTGAKQTWYEKNPLWPKKTITKTLNQLYRLKKQGYPINNLEQNEINTIRWYFTHPDKPLPQTCRIALRNFYIDHHGDITICQNYPSIGNIFKENPKDIWKSKKAESIRTKINMCRRDCQLLLCNRPHDIRRLMRSFLAFLQK